MLSVRFWGVRGSMPCPGPETVVFGGNTSCLEIRADDRLVIIDMGTGIRPLGDRLMDGDYISGPVDADVFISHTHWDHIMGFPMFNPIFSPETKLRIRGPVLSVDDKLSSIIGAQFSNRYWPVKLSDLSAQIEYHEIKEGEFDLGEGLKVITKSLNHPLHCLGFRFEYGGKSIVTIYDHEQNNGDDDSPIKKFSENADILIHDSQYTAEELQKHLGWGHSSYEYVYGLAVRAGVKKLVFFHHDPKRSDVQLEAIEKEYNAKIAGKPMEILAAREGLLVLA